MWSKLNQLGNMAKTIAKDIVAAEDDDEDEDFFNQVQKPKEENNKNTKDLFEDAF